MQEVGFEPRTAASAVWRVCHIANPWPHFQNIINVKFDIWKLYLRVNVELLQMSNLYFIPRAQAPGTQPLHVRLPRGLAGWLDEEQPRGDLGGEVRGAQEAPQEEDDLPLPGTT